MRQSAADLDRIVVINLDRLAAESAAIRHPGHGAFLVTFSR
jgi:hypothetical protein